MEKVTSNIGRFTIGRTLGEGASCKVKLGYDTTNHNRKVAIKIMNDNMNEEERRLMDQEITAMKILKHQNVVQIIDNGFCDYVKGDKKKSVYFIALELAPKGQLFDFINISGAFEEPLARFWFKQFMNGLNFCHQNGVCHRDLKPENLLVDNNYTLIIADFGFACSTTGTNENGMCQTHLGTELYMAPEIHLGQEYDGQQVDIFASAVILFIMVAGHPPFSAAHPKDSYYKALAMDRQDLFWHQHEKQSQMSFSKEFKDVVQSMLQLDPSGRPTMQELMSHDWYQGEVASNDEVLAEFSKRSSKIEEANKTDRTSKSKQTQKEQRTDTYIKNRRSGEEQVSNKDKLKQADEALLKPMKNLEQYEGQSSLLNVITSFNPDIIEEDIIKYLTYEKITPKVDEKKYKIKFDFEAKMDTLKQFNYKVSVCIRILKVDEEQVCVEFSKLAGPLDKFKEIVDGLKTSNCLANVIA